MLTKEMLLENIKTYDPFEHLLSFDNVSIGYNEHASIEYNKFLSGKSVNCLKVNISSKTENSVPLVSDNILNDIINDMRYKIIIGDNESLDEKFENDINLLVSDIILLRTIKWSLIEIKLYCNSKKKLRKYINLLNIKIYGTTVEFNENMESKIHTTLVCQTIVDKNGRQNKLSIKFGMAGLAYDKYLEKEEHDEMEII